MIRSRRNGPRSLILTFTDLPLSEVGDPHDRAERQRAVGGGQSMHVEALTARRVLSLVRLPYHEACPVSAR